MQQVLRRYLAFSKWKCGLLVGGLCQPEIFCMYNILEIKGSFVSLFKWLFFISFPNDVKIMLLTDFYFEPPPISPLVLQTSVKSARSNV